MHVKRFCCSEVENERKGRSHVVVARKRTWSACALSLSYNNLTTTNTQNLLYVLHRWYSDCYSHTPGSHSVCAIKTSVEVDQKILLAMWWKEKWHAILIHLFSFFLLLCVYSIIVRHYWSCRQWRIQFWYEFHRSGVCKMHIAIPLYIMKRPILSSAWINLSW